MVATSRSDVAVMADGGLFFIECVQDRDMRGWTINKVESDVSMGQRKAHHVIEYDSDWLISCALDQPHFVKI